MTRIRLPALVFLISSAIAAAPACATPQVGDPAPALKGTLFSGKPFDLAKQRGKVVLINYYSSYSKQCAYEIGNVEAFLEEYRDKGLVVIYIGVDRPQDRERVERMVKLYNLDGMMSNELEENGFGKKFRAPRAFVIDRKGIVRSREYGGKTPVYFQKYLIPVLSE